MAPINLMLKAEPRSERARHGLLTGAMLIDMQTYDPRCGTTRHRLNDRGAPFTLFALNRIRDLPSTSRNPNGLSIPKGLVDRCLG